MTCWRRLRDWNKADVWQRLVAAKLGAPWWAVCGALIVAGTVVNAPQLINAVNAFLRGRVEREALRAVVPAERLQEQLTDYWDRFRSRTEVYGPEVPAAQRGMAMYAGT